MRGVLETPSGCGFLSCRRIPGVRKKRVPLANFLAPLRGALKGETSEPRSGDRLDYYSLSNSPADYGEQDENGIDLSLIRRNLHLTPTERLRRADRECRALMRMREDVRRNRKSALERISEILISESDGCRWPASSNHLHPDQKLIRALRATSRAPPAPVTRPKFVELMLVFGSSN